MEKSEKCEGGGDNAAMETEQQTDHVVQQET